MKPEEIVKLSDEAADALRRAAKIVSDPRFHDQLRATAFDVETVSIVRGLRKPGA